MSVLVRALPILTGKVQRLGNVGQIRLYDALRDRVSSND